MSDKFGFEYGVFITINSKQEYITNKIKESFDLNGFKKMSINMKIYLKE